MMIMVIAPPSLVHWTTTAGFWVSVATALGTFVYVYFTYRIMNWAVAQGKAGLEVSRLTIEDARLRKALIDDKVKTLLFEIYLMCGMIPLLESDYAELAEQWTNERTIANLRSRVNEIREMHIPDELRTPLGHLNSSVSVYQPLDGAAG